MEMYRKFRGADPDKTPMLKARGLWKEPVVEVDTTEVVESVEPAAKPMRPAFRPNNPSTQGKPNFRVPVKPEAK
jgi:hypothetical protein